ncbi:histidine phosphatase superfamily [Talaromyces proteolyticus]|uniref:Histidine phosphatase superfamily n=1 Tax=Talaromyces proteolyticus TaxID=1131652 RepID=A0AAD4Q5X2_9EURO|nr:histidine phosphatase superfamily [Talaromyces proteolyticus]KAH8705071.1 histidine phosphatase superfamily [Talaromyces proteolyticus]
MAPIVHFVRHAQGYHNLSTANHVLPDPELTQLGEQQCAKLRDSFPNHSKIELVAASPLRRTIRTALLSFQPVFEAHKDFKIVCIPEAQETSDVPCDTGSDPAVLQKEFVDSGLPVDISLVKDGWNSKQGKWSPNAAALRNRAREVRQWLRARPEKEVVLVTHGGLLHFLTEDWEDSSLYQGTGWRNTEYRTYHFSDKIDFEDINGEKLNGDDATIIEIPESRTRRGKSPEAPSREEQKANYKKGLDGWNAQGLQPSQKERGTANVSAGVEVNGSRI